MLTQADRSTRASDAAVEIGAYRTPVRSGVQDTEDVSCTLINDEMDNKYIRVDIVSTCHAMTDVRDKLMPTELPSVEVVQSKSVSTS